MWYRKRKAKQPSRSLWTMPTGGFRVFRQTGQESSIHPVLLEIWMPHPNLQQTLLQESHPEVYNCYSGLGWNQSTEALRFRRLAHLYVPFKLRQLYTARGADLNALLRYPACSGLKSPVSRTALPTRSAGGRMAKGVLIRSLRPLAVKYRCLASSTAVAPRVSEEDVKQFEEDGATVVRQPFSPEWIEQLREAAELNMKNPGPLCDEHVKPGEPGRFHDDQFLWMRSEVMKKFIFESPAAELAKRMSRANQVRLLYDQLFVKEPGTKTTTPWHNDHSYWPVTGNQVISLWLALDHVPKSNCVQYVKGSHKWELLHKLTSFSGDKDRYKAANVTSLPEVPDIDSMLDQVELLAWDLQPGDCLVHHSFSMHGAPGISSTSNRRRAYATRWVGDAVRYDPRPGTMEFLWRHKAGLDVCIPPGSPMDSPLFPAVF